MPRVVAIAAAAGAFFWTAAVAVTLPGAARAQSSYPSRPITFVIPTSPGTGTDILTRLYAERVGKLLNASVNVVNRPGAAGLMAAQAVASVPADGYTFLIANSGHTNLGLIHKNLTFDPVNDFMGIAMFADAPMVLGVPPALEVKSLTEFVELAKRKPGSLNYLTLGTGSASHIATVYLEKQAGISLSHVPYKDANVAESDLMGNLVQLIVSPVGPLVDRIKTGKILGLAVSTRESMSDPIVVPSAISQGVDYVHSIWYGFFALKGTPSEAMEKLDRAISDAAKSPDIIAKVEALGMVSKYLPAAEFQQHIRNEIDRLAPAIKEIEDGAKASR